MKKIVYVEPAEYFPKAVLEQIEKEMAEKEKQEVSIDDTMTETMPDKAWDEYVTNCGGIKPVVLDKEWNEKI